MLKLGADGTPSPAFPPGGRQLTTTDGASQMLEDPSLVPDGASGSWLAFPQIFSTNPSNANAMLTHLDAAGLPLPGWPFGGRSVTASSGTQAQTAICPDGAGGVFVSWCDFRTGAGRPDPEVQDYYDIYLQHILADGTVAPGWPADGLPVCIWPGIQQASRLVPDGNGGAYIAWELSGPQGNAVHAQHVLGNGTLAQGWPVGGRRMFGDEGYADRMRMCTDGLGGFFISCSIYTDDWHVYLQHVNAAGQFDAVWGPAGYRVVPASFLGINRQDHAELTLSAPGVVVACWNDYRSGNEEAYATRIGINGVVAATASLVDQQVSADAVSLTWQSFDGSIGEATLERRTPDGPWASIATLSADGEGRLQYEDRAVEQGAQYTYRLAWQSFEGTQRSSETSVLVPVLARFALRGATPNPSPRGALSVRYSLEAGTAPARIELYDLQGRCVSSRDLTTAGPGEHLLQLPDARRLDTGVYWLRLSQGTQRATVRIVLVD